MIALVCLAPDMVASVMAQFPRLATAFDPETPRHYRRDIRQLAALNHAALTLERSRRDSLASTAFLLPLLSELTATAPDMPPDTPVWLQDACIAAQAPDVFRAGSAGFVAQTGKAHAHVSRMMRKHLGQTPSHFINELRMDHAARALVTDSEPLSVIASDCGIPNLSHFHKLFRARFGMTPLKYRQSLQRDIVQP